VTIKGRLKAIKETLGDLPVRVLEKPAEILRFKAVYRKGREIATVNRALSTLRAAINWGRFQDPPYLTTTPFHRFGVSIKVKEETKRDRRIGLQEEQALLAAGSEMNGADHRFVGSSMHDRIIGALETCCRQGEMLRIQIRRVDWEQHQIAIPGRHAKDAENRPIPFDPQGRLTPILKRRAALGPNGLCLARRPESIWAASRPPGNPYPAGEWSRHQIVRRHRLSTGPSKSGAPGWTRTSDPRLRRLRV
jgi:integrase